MYSLARKILFSLDPELSHELSLDLMGAGHRLGMLKWFAQRPLSAPRDLMGLHFENPVGLAAGLDKNGDYFDALGDFGFGFIEIGTVTPRAQPGNPKPRLFRLEEDGAIINRMGFNNKGVDYLVERVKKRRYPGVLGINIGKNKDTADAQAIDDYLHCLRKVYPYADYVTVNISSPNTPGLRNLQFGDSFSGLLKSLKAEQSRLAKQYRRRVPMCIKFSPDNEEAQIQRIAKDLKQYEIEGIIVSNTTVNRDALLMSPDAGEQGGLSGKPLALRANESIRQFRAALGASFPIIGVGGIFSADDGREKIAAGANILQIYSGFIYRGPALISELALALV